MKKLLVVFGTRPEAIKMAPLVKELINSNTFEIKVCVTAQHREMLDQVLEFFKINPDFDLDLMKKSQSLNELSSRVLNSFHKVLIAFKPEMVLVHGDTTTSSMCALAAFHNEIKVGHIEAGLRTYNKWSPFPEEMNRQITGKLADYHFTPTAMTADNLLREGVAKETIFITGNTVIDALHWGVENINENRNEIKFIQDFIDKTKKLIVVTGHRRENFGEKFKSFCTALKDLGKREDVQIIYPVHLNPNVKDVVFEELSSEKNILLLDPLDYEVFIWLLNQSYLIITDSGGIQEEAPSLNKPVLVTREVTERQEAIEAGTVKLVGTNQNSIVKEVELLLNDEKAYSLMISQTNPYGNGTASKQIVEVLKSL